MIDKKGVQRLVLVLGSLCLTCAILEAALRFHVVGDVHSSRRPEKQDPVDGACPHYFVDDPVRGWRPATGCVAIGAETRNNEYAVTQNANNHGFRDNKDYRYEKSPGVTRLVVIGDSFSFGNGVEELARYSNLLDDLLGRNVEVYNLAVSNYGLDQAFLTLRNEGVKYRPDVIVLGFSEPMFHRLTRRITASRWSKPIFRIEEGQLRLIPQPNAQILALDSPLERSYLWDFVSRRIAALWRRVDARRELATKTALTEKIIEQLQETAGRSGAKLVVFPINPLEVLTRDLAESPELNRLLERLAARHHFDFLDLYPAVKRLPYTRLFYPIDRHYNVAGHILVAEQLCRFLRDENVLPGLEDQPCEIDADAVDAAVERFRQCDYRGTKRGLFLGGKCYPLGCDRVGRGAACVLDDGSPGHRVCSDFKTWGKIWSECGRQDTCRT